MANKALEALLDNPNVRKALESLAKASEPGQGGKDIIDALPAPYQLREEVEDNEIVLFVGDREVARTGVHAPDYSIKELHPDRFVEQVDKAREDTLKARSASEVYQKRVLAVESQTKPDRLRDAVISGGDSLEDLASRLICADCDKSFQTEKQLHMHQMRMAHGEYAEGMPKWEQSFIYKQEAKEQENDETGDTGVD